MLGWSWCYRFVRCEIPLNAGVTTYPATFTVSNPDAPVFYERVGLRVGALVGYAVNPLHCGLFVWGHCEALINFFIARSTARTSSRVFWVCSHILPVLVVLMEVPRSGCRQRKHKNNPSESDDCHYGDDDEVHLILSFECFS